MMMQRSHLEDALAAKLEAAHLNHHAHQFDDVDTADEQKQYLNGEMDRINKVKAIMLSSIENSTRLLKKK